MRPSVDPDLQARLEASDGLEISASASLAEHTTFRIGGPAELLVKILSESALGGLLRTLQGRNVGFQVLGLGSNVLIPDAGVPGIVAVLAGDFLELRFDGQMVEAGAALPLARVARRALKRGLVGLEALAGFPSTVGGAVLMNAGCYGVEIRDVLESVVVYRPHGGRQVLTVEELDPGYRCTNLQGSGAIVARARFQLRVEDPARALETMESINRKRRQSLPSGRPNVGSIFKNPPGDFAGRLIEACGLKGSRRGDAEISPRHANVIVNRGRARASEVLELMCLARRAVLERFGIALEPEVILVGELGARWQELTATTSAVGADPS